ncbi:hypothetical protein KAU37_02545 [Candidatus Bipolaricaulota bacterium]|nr:hypothetical protein [Candidatus Bipolaricaulota bacterium]
MSDRLKDFKIEFQNTGVDCQRFCYAARAREFQVEAIQRLEALQTKASALKTEMVTVGDESSANQLLSLEEMLQALIYELQMWVAFKDADPHAAWTALIGAQSAARTAMQAHDIADHLDAYIERLYALEKLLFPPQMFMSVGIIIKQSTCSICGHEYGECDHLKGKAYMGQMCTRLIEESELWESSIVSDPANKHCRILTFSDGDSTRDLMTWRPIPSVQDEEE